MKIAVLIDVFNLIGQEFLNLLMRIKSCFLLFIIPVTLFNAVKSLKFVNGAYCLRLFYQPYAFLTNTVNNSLSITQEIDNKQDSAMMGIGMPAEIEGLSYANLCCLTTSESTHK